MIRLKQLRTSKNMTLKELGEKASVDPKYISIAEKRGYQLGDQQLCRLSIALGWRERPSKLLEEVEGEESVTQKPPKTRLGKVRRGKRMSQHDLWAETKVPVTDISRVENGWLKLSDERQARIAKALDWEGDPAELFEPLEVEQ